MPTCIYCRATQRTQFPAEHVIPKSFGRFRQHPTLHCVCGECNQYFGTHLELQLGRERAESVVRFEHGLRESPAAVRNSKMTARINVPGLAFGAKVELRPNTKAGKGSEIIYVPQVAFPTKNSDEWKWYTLEDLNAETLQSLGPISEAKYLVTSPAEEERLKSRLRELGLQPGKLIERNSFSPQPEVKTRVTCLFDLNIVRCVAKIAFNYLAYVLGEDTRLLLRDEFESIRNFARHRLNPETDIVYFSGKPKLGADERKNSLVDGHILAVGWDAAKENLICGLSFFNAMSYKVVLCRKHRAVWFPVNNAHSFDLRTREVKKIPLGFWTHEAPPE